MIRPYDTQPPRPTKVPAAPMGTKAGLLECLEGLEYRFVQADPPELGMTWDLYVEPKGYHEARRAVHWTAPVYMYVNIIPLELTS